MLKQLQECDALTGLVGSRTKRDKGREQKGGQRGNLVESWRGRTDIFYLLLSSCLSRHPTAVMSAAPLPLPSSDSRKLTLHWGASSFTVWCMILEKLDRGKRFDRMLKSEVMNIRKTRETDSLTFWGCGIASMAAPAEISSYMFNKLNTNWNLRVSEGVPLLALSVILA